MPVLRSSSGRSSLFDLRSIIRLDPPDLPDLPHQLMAHISPARTSCGILTEVRTRGASTLARSRLHGRSVDHAGPRHRREHRRCSRCSIGCSFGLVLPRRRRLVRSPPIKKGSRRRTSASTIPTLFDLAARGDVFTEVSGLYPINVNLTGSDEPERIEAQLVSASYFRTLGVGRAEWPHLRRVGLPAGHLRKSPSSATARGRGASAAANRRSAGRSGSTTICSRSSA